MLETYKLIRLPDSGRFVIRNTSTHAIVTDGRGFKYFTTADKAKAYVENRLNGMCDPEIERM